MFKVYDWDDNNTKGDFIGEVIAGITKKINSRYTKLNLGFE